MRQALFATVLLFLAGCGFHLKGDWDLSHLPAVGLNIPDEALRGAVEKHLTRQGVSISATAPVQITVQNVERERFQVAIGKTRNSREFELTEAIEVTVQKDEKLLGRTTLESRGTVQYQSGQYLGNVEEENQITAHLSDENAQRLIRYLRAISK